VSNNIDQILLSVEQKSQKRLEVKVVDFKHIQQ